MGRSNLLHSKPSCRRLEETSLMASPLDPMVWAAQSHSLLNSARCTHQPSSWLSVLLDQVPTLTVPMSASTFPTPRASPRLYLTSLLRSTPALSERDKLIRKMHERKL